MFNTKDEQPVDFDNYKLNQNYVTGFLGEVTCFHMQISKKKKQNWNWMGYQAYFQIKLHPEEILEKIRSYLTVLVLFIKLKLLG